MALLLDRERPAGELAEGAGMRQPVASQHLRVLRNAGLVHVRAQGNQRIYTVDFEGLTQLREQLEAFWGPSLDALKQASEAAAKHRADR